MPNYAFIVPIYAFTVPIYAFTIPIYVFIIPIYTCIMPIYTLIVHVARLTSRTYPQANLIRCNCQVINIICDARSVFYCIWFMYGHLYYICDYL